MQVARRTPLQRVVDDRHLPEAYGPKLLPQLLFMQLGHGALRAFAGFRPVVVHSAGARLGFQRGNGGQRQHLIQIFLRTLRSS